MTRGTAVAATGPPSAPLSVGGAAARVGVALAAFAAVLALLHAFAAPGGGGIVGAKLEHYRDAPERYDTVFLGSSHVYRSFVPERFDEALREHGVEARSFNFGVQLPNLYETSYLLEEILARGEGRVRRVFCEYLPSTPQIDPQNAYLPRTVYWHDAETTGLAVSRAFALADELADDGEGGLRFAEEPSTSITSLLARPFPVPLRIAAGHVLHFGARAVLVGRGKDVAKGVLGREHGQTAAVARGAGYLSLEEQQRLLEAAGQLSNPYRRRHEHFLENLDAYRSRVEALRTEPVVFGDEEWMNADLQRVDDVEVLRRMAEACRAAGVELILVFMPANSCNRPLEERLPAELGVPVLRFNRPSVYPRLYEPELRFDSGHPSAEGANELTRLLAREYLALQG